MQAPPASVTIRVSSINCIFPTDLISSDPKPHAKLTSATISAPLRTSFFRLSSFWPQTAHYFLPPEVHSAEILGLYEKQYAFVSSQRPARNNMYRHQLLTAPLRDLGRGTSQLRISVPAIAVSRSVIQRGSPPPERSRSTRRTRSV